jgi:hypothetical protein
MGAALRLTSKACRCAGVTIDASASFALIAGAPFVVVGCALTAAGTSMINAKKLVVLFMIFIHC